MPLAEAKARGIHAMPATVLKLHQFADAEPAGHEGRVPVLVPPMLTDHPAMLNWAQAVDTAAQQRVAALESRLAYLETQVASDELTGLLNRRGFLSVFARANAAAKRGSDGGVLVVCDLDGFKQVNDRYGHAEGDDLLRRLGGILRRKTRKMDATARLGGDEFALMMVGVSIATARRKCQWLEKVIGTIGLGASFGLAAFNGEESEDAVLHRADMAMYAEKRRKAAQTSTHRP
jgi:diguanylate cyclase (GGDEF)-like protein